jgi:hypothetical protein
VRREIKIDGVWLLKTCVHCLIEVFVASSRTKDVAFVACVKRLHRLAGGLRLKVLFHVGFLGRCIVVFGFPLFFDQSLLNTQIPRNLTFLLNNIPIIPFLKFRTFNPDAQTQT